MKAILVIAITMLMNGGTGDGFMDFVLGIPQTDISVCEEAKKAIRSNTYTNSSEYRDEYKFQIREVWCELNEGLLELPPLDK